MRKYLLGLSCAVVALAAGSAHAQSTKKPAATSASQTTSDQDGTETKDRVEEREILVTGSRFKKLLDAPQLKSIISAEERNLAGVNSATELVRVQPGFNITDDYGINVRGIGRQTAQTLLGQENTVTQYVDGFLNQVPGDIGESTLFGGNVTFIRGPAGTTYGRNAIAGAINVLSRAPTKDFTAQGQVGTARHGAYNVGVNISGPITSNLGFRVGVQEYVSPSIFKAVGGVDGAGFAANNTYIEFQLDWRLGAFHVKNRATTFAYDNQPGYPTLSGYANNLNGNVTPVFGGLSPNPAYGYAGPVPNQPYQTNVNTRGYDRLRKNFQDIMNADLDLGFATMYYVGGYQTYLATGQADQDLTSRTSYNGDTVAPGTFAAGTQVPTDYRTNYYSDNYFFTQEVRLEGKPGPFQWITGLYYYNQDFDEQYWENIVNATDAILTPTIGTPGLTLAPNPRRSTYEQRNKYQIRSTAVFGNIQWDISPTLRFDGGLRYTWDEKNATTNFRFVFYYPPVFAGDFSPLVHSANPNRREEGLSGRAALAWRPGNGDQLYVSYARGYQSSAFTLAQGVPGPNPNDPQNIADKEFLDVYEVGGNVSFGRLRFDGSLFYQVFHNQQIPISTRNLIGGPNGPVLGPVFTTFFNAARTDIYGGEAQISWRPTSHSSIVASYTYLHPKFKNFTGPVDITEQCNAAPLQPNTQCTNSAGAGYFAPTNPLYNTPQNLSGNDLSRAPRHKMAAYGYYGIDLGGVGHIYPGGSVFHQTGFYTQQFNVPRFRVPGRTVVNATLTYRTADDRLDITGVVSNLFRVRYADSSALATFGSGTATQAVYYGADQYWTLTARYRF